MKKSLFKFVLLGSALCFSFFSYGCQSSNGLQVPGESEIITKNIASEYFTIAEGYADLKKYDKAADYYKLAMKNKDLRLSAYYKMARCYALSKNYDKAEEAYTNLLKLDPENKDIKLSLAYIHAKTEQYDKAIGEYEKLSQDYPNEVSVYENYMNLLIFNKQFEDANKLFPVVKEKFPDNTNIKAWEDSISSGLEPNAESLPPAEESEKLK